MLSSGMEHSPPCVSLHPGDHLHLPSQSTHLLSECAYPACVLWGGRDGGGRAREGGREGGGENNVNVLLLLSYWHKRKLVIVFRSKTVAFHVMTFPEGPTYCTLSPSLTRDPFIRVVLILIMLLLLDAIFWDSCHRWNEVEG